MKTFNNMKIAVANPTELRQVIHKLVSLGYGIGSNREARTRDYSYTAVFASADGMILFGRDSAQLFQTGTAFDRCKYPAVAVEDLLA